ncbi:MAG TPA: HAD-IA family hydrolase, partial [Lachnospiraceae bacterium]|nr:HAD-IA family hydrolase [Lachnospiraceae bacterium]
SLKKSGKTIILATSKPEEFANEILKYFSLDKYFDFIAGATMDGARCKKAEIIKYALNCNGITELEKVIMVGDRKHDIFGANQIGIDSVGVLFGYGSNEELRKSGATYIAESVEDIMKYMND